MRVRPGLDEKALFGWNALMVQGLLQVAVQYRDDATFGLYQRLMRAMFSNFRRSDGTYWHQITHGKPAYETYLDDYAYWIDALIGDVAFGTVPEALDEATRLADMLLERFFDEGEQLFYFTADGQNELPVRKINLYDNATPSGNSVMCRNLMRLATLTGQHRYRRIAEQMMSRLRDAVVRYPSSFSVWALALLEVVRPPVEVAIVGPEAAEYRDMLLRSADFPPNAILQIATEATEHGPLLSGKTPAPDGSTRIYICRNYACAQPVRTVADALTLIRTA